MSALNVDLRNLLSELERDASALVVRAENEVEATPTPDARSALQRARGQLSGVRAVIAAIEVRESLRGPMCGGMLCGRRR